MQTATLVTYRVFQTPPVIPFWKPSRNHFFEVHFVFHDVLEIKERDLNSFQFMFNELFF